MHVSEEVEYTVIIDDGVSSTVKEGVIVAPLHVATSTTQQRAVEQSFVCRWRPQDVSQKRQCAVKV